MNLAKAWAAQMDDYVIGLTWSPDGRSLAAASAAGPIGVYDGVTGAKLHELSGHSDGTNAVAFAPAAIGVAGPGSGPLLASGGQDGFVRFWDALGGKQSAEVNAGHGAWVENLQWKPTATDSNSQNPNLKMLAAAAGRKLLFLNPEGSIIHAFKDAPQTLSALAWHPGGGAIAAASFDRVVILDADDFRVQREFAYSGAIETLTWSPDGRWLVAGAQNNAVHLWIPEEDQEFHMSGYETKVRELSFSSDSRWLATGGSRDACVWDCTGAGPEGREPVALPHSTRVSAVAFQHTRDLLATAAIDGEVGFWRLTDGETRVAAVKLTAPPSSLAWSPDDNLLAIGSQKGGVLALRVAN
jgi:WD40 repeat protein